VSLPPLAPGGGAVVDKLGSAFAVLATVGLVSVVAAAGRYADGDMGHLIAVEMRLAQHLRAGELWTAATLWWALIAPQPPLGYLPGILGHTLLGFRQVVAPLTMGVGLLLCWDALRRTWGSRAWLAWLPILASPLTWLSVEQHSRDLLAGAALLQALSWLCASDGFKQRAASVGFGVWLGIGFMTKYTFPIFAVAPCLAAGVALLGVRSRGRFANLGFGLLGFCGPAGLWYAHRGLAVLDYAGFSFGDKMAGNTANFRDPYTVSSLLYYPLSLRDAISAPGLALVALAAVLGATRPGDRRRVGYFLTAAAGGVAVLSTVPEAIDRYAIPGFLALLAVVPALAPEHPPRAKATALAGVVALGLFGPQAAATVGRFRPGAPVQVAAYDHEISSLWSLAWPTPSTYRPADMDPGSWRLDEAVAAIVSAQGRTSGTIGVLSGRGPEAGPSFATVLMAAAAAGCSYDFATINPRPAPGAPGAFVGPLFDGTSPSAVFSTLVVFRPQNADPSIEQWLRAHRAVEVARLASDPGRSASVYTVRP
jgi:4-amino-4-deoxy-L-arabinose transferase-like glycosyltransferase